jgi:hypothetical protein
MSSGCIPKWEDGYIPNIMMLSTSGTDTYRYDRSEKETGLGELVPGMSLNDLHSPFYLSAGNELCRQVFPDEEIILPLFASFMTDASVGDSLLVVHEMEAWDQFGHHNYVASSENMIPYKPWFQGHLADLNVHMPCYPGLALLSWRLETRTGKILHRNFTTFYITAGNTPERETLTRQGTSFDLVRFRPASYVSASWTTKTRQVLNGLKVWGDGSGYFEYRIQWPSGLKKDKIGGLTFLFEASAKELLGKTGLTASNGTEIICGGKGSMTRDAIPMPTP